MSQARFADLPGFPPIVMFNRGESAGHGKFVLLVLPLEKVLVSPFDELRTNGCILIIQGFTVRGELVEP